MTRDELKEALRRGETGKVIDAHLWCLFIGKTMHEKSNPEDGTFAFWVGEPWKSECINCSRWTSLTTSIDAADALVEEVRPGYSWRRASNGSVTLTKPSGANGGWVDVAHGRSEKTPAALCLALLEATEGEK